jgi:hypothetical protein
VIADLATRRLDDCDEDEDVLVDAAMVWSVLNMLAKEAVDGDDADIMCAARADFLSRLAECGLTEADLFEHVVDAVTNDDFGRFALRRQPDAYPGVYGPIDAARRRTPSR